MMIQVPEEIVEDNRLGMVVFPKEWMRIHPSLMEEMNDTLYVLEASQVGDNDEVIIRAYCDKFDSLSTNDRVPRYAFDFEEWKKSGKVIFTKVPGYSDNVYTNVNGG